MAATRPQGGLVTGTGHAVEVEPSQERWPRLIAEHQAGLAAARAARDAAEAATSERAALSIARSNMLKGIFFGALLTVSGAGGAARWFLDGRGSVLRLLSCVALLVGGLALDVLSVHLVNRYRHLRSAKHTSRAPR